MDVGDDTVAIKSGMDFAGRHFAHPAENILFRNCHFVQNAMAIGKTESIVDLRDYFLVVLGLQVAT